MLTGEPPFAGNTSTVMRAHREQKPQALRDRNNKIPKRAAKVVMSALSKNPAERPQTAFAFASAVRAGGEAGAWVGEGWVGGVQHGEAV